MLFFACSSAETTEVESETNTPVYDEDLVLDDDSPTDGTVENFIIKDIDSKSFELYDKLESKAVIILYTDIINNPESVKAFDYYTTANSNLYYPLVMSKTNDYEGAVEAINTNSYESTIILDSNLRMYKEFQIENSSTTIVIDKDKQIKAYIKREILDSAIYSKMLRGVINE